tara:strand:+ start:703 stop:1575 length:873 start_codon:yes stop_codon:yes gene_type:complete
MKGIILAGGRNTRLKPLTNAITKQLLPIYNKPMIFYPLSTLMLAGIKDILIISNPGDIELIKKLLGKGLQLGINISYQMQKKPDGIAQALKIGKKFIDNKPVTLILGDNLFFGSNLGFNIKNAIKNNEGATIFAYNVYDPSMYGVVKLSKNGKPLSIIEKPKRFISNYAITGLYIYDKYASNYVSKIKKSKRNELEITDLNKIYLKNKNLNVNILNRGSAWLDMGTFDSLSNASEFVKTIETRQGFMISCPEEIAWRNSWINNKELLKISRYYKNNYGKYLEKLAKLNEN